jgi:threonine/homoserine/homoserine lactone efflux protein
MSFLEGFLTGVGTIIFLGPVFFTLLQITLDRGLKAGFSVAIGILSSDILIVFLFYFGARELFQDDEIQFWLATGWFAVLAYLVGVTSILLLAGWSPTFH